MIYDGFVDAIGNTPLIKLRAAWKRSPRDGEGREEAASDRGAA